MRWLLQLLEASAARRVRARGALLMRANVLQALGRLRQAEKAYVELARLYPGDRTVLVDAAEYFADGGAHRRASAYFARALAIKRPPTDRVRRAAIVLKASRCLQESGNRDRAMQLLARSIESALRQDILVRELCALVETSGGKGNRPRRRSIRGSRRTRR